MKWLVSLCLFCLGCGDGKTPQERYAIEKDVLTKLEDEYGRPESEYSRRVLRIRLIEEQLKEGAEQIYLDSQDPRSPGDAEAKVKELRSELGPLQARMDELAPKVKAQQKRVADAEADL